MFHLKTGIKRKNNYFLIFAKATDSAHVRKYSARNFPIIFEPKCRQASILRRIPKKMTTFFYQLPLEIGRGFETSAETWAAHLRHNQILVSEAGDSSLKYSTRHRLLISFA